MQAPPTYVPGQRWTSLTEPELGLGAVELIDGRQVVISYPAREVTRRYETSEAPLARARLSAGQNARDLQGNEFRVESISVEDEVLIYHGEGRSLRESELDPELDVVNPENRLLSAQVDEHRLFDLRREALSIRHHMLASPARGFLGGRIQLFEHQLSIARDVCERHRARVLLADEVGLGKTIEALLILHRMLLTERIERVLVLVPRALVHQWLAEAYLRFNLVFRVLGRDSLDSGLLDPQNESLHAQLFNSRLCICPLDEEGSAALEDEDFDLLIVDEAHHLAPESAAFGLVQRLSRRIDHLLILSATPDRDGEAAHFGRLALLDPARFHDFETYKQEAAHYQALADTAERLQSGEPLTPGDRQLLAKRLKLPDLEALMQASSSDPAARRQLLGRLLDLHGIGRVMFRNVRSRIPGFPRRIHHPVLLEGGDPEALRAEFLGDMGLSKAPELPKRDARSLWLREFLEQHPEARVLALCSTKEKVERFASAIETKARKVARFHEAMSSLERDRQAAWFLADDGPQLLISSAIGAEGRNFQVAQHLVLLDLPSTPDRLEQLIGRVDRIGQGDEVFLHTPVVQGTPQERLVRWYGALQLFETPWHGSPAIERELGAEVLAAAIDRSEASESVMQALIERGRARNLEIVAQLEGGRDRLLELTSFDLEAAEDLAHAIARAQDDRELEHFMVHAFERAGLLVERIAQRSYALRVGPDYHRPFPGFTPPEMGITFDRGIGMEHPERLLLTYDHPLVRDTLDDLLSRESGNASIAQLPVGQQTGLLLEALFVAEPTVSRKLRADRFFPPSPVRIVLDIQGRPVPLDAAQLQDRLRPCSASLLQHESLQPRLKPLQERARALAEAQGPALAAAARKAMQRELSPCVDRLEDLLRSNPSASLEEELQAAREELALLEQGLSQVRVRLDALRVILLVPAAS